MARSDLKRRDSMLESRRFGLAPWLIVLVAAVVVLCLTAALPATTFPQFNKMDIYDQAEFIAVMVNATQMALRNAGQADKAAQIEQLFTMIEPGDATSVGLVELERNLALARVYAAKDAEKDPKAKPIEVEDALFVTLEKNKIPMTTNVMNAVMDALANFHAQTFAEFAAKSPAEQRGFIALLVKYAWPDYEFRDTVQARLSHKDSFLDRPDVKRDMLTVVNTKFPIQSPEQPGFAEFAKKIEAEYKKSPNHEIFNNLTIYILEESDALTVKRIAKLDANSVVLPDSRHVFPDDKGNFWFYPKDMPSQERQLESQYQALAKRLLECKERRGIANGEEALTACRNEPGVAAAEMQAEEAVQEKARAETSVRQNVCISDDLTTEWRNPPAGGKMESLKRLLIQSLRERAKTSGYDQTRWIAVDSRYYSAWPNTSWGNLVSTIPGGSCGAAGHSEILALAP